MQHLDPNSLDAILALAETHALQAWAPLNRWLERNVLAASDEELRRALAAQRDLSSLIRH